MSCSDTGVVKTGVFWELCSTEMAVNFFYAYTDLATEGRTKKGLINYVWLILLNVLMACNPHLVKLLALKVWMEQFYIWMEQLNVYNYPAQISKCSLGLHCSSSFDCNLDATELSENSPYTVRWHHCEMCQMLRLVVLQLNFVWDAEMDLF